jgi:tetratricopeptide (TPR) repeat protein
MSIKQLLPCFITCISLSSVFISEESLANESLLEIAQQAFAKEQLETAQTYIEKALQQHPEKPDALYLAGRIAAKQAQQANIFSKLSYAKDAKNYFEQALSIAPQHRDAIVGLIRFHQEAPVLAGGEKESIPDLVAQLKQVDEKAAFSFEVQKMLQEKPLEWVHQSYLRALNSSSAEQDETFKYDYAMWLSNFGYHSKALDVLMSIDKNNQAATQSFSAMLHYQLAKQAAESKRQLALGITSIEQYAQLPAEQRTISDEWISFRLTQLRYLNQHSDTSIQDFERLKEESEDGSLKRKISQFLALLET